MWQETKKFTKLAPVNWLMMLSIVVRWSMSARGFGVSEAVVVVGGDVPLKSLMLMKKYPTSYAHLENNTRSTQSNHVTLLPLEEAECLFSNDKYQTDPKCFKAEQHNLNRTLLIFRPKILHFHTVSVK